jgi:hypothetical protein
MHAIGYPFPYWGYTDSGLPANRWNLTCSCLLCGSARINLVVGEAEAGGNHLLEFRGFESLPVKPSQQPEPSLACECGNALLEA